LGREDAFIYQRHSDARSLDNGTASTGMKIPSPCIDVCKFKHAGYCIGCGMTKKQKKKFKRLKRKDKRHFVEALPQQQHEVGINANWERAYRRRCEKKGVDCPLDRLPGSNVGAPAAL
jgi:predicted Fe-S protein YdhL (DUF1289 family)